MAQPSLLHTVTPQQSFVSANELTHAPVPPAQADDAGRAGRLGLWALALGLGGFLFWAAVAPLDEGVPSQGMVTLDTKRKAVQHPVGGIVKEVLVGEGQRVKDGQLLLRLDAAATRANYEAIRQHYLSLRATQGRLLAEQAGLSRIVFHPDLQSAVTDPQIRSQISTQEQLFQSRKAALRAELQGLQESIEGQHGLLRAYESMLSSRRHQLTLLEEELRNTRELVRDGYAPRNRQLELERMVAEANAFTSELLGNITRGQRAVGELRQRVIGKQQEYRKEVETLLTEVTREVQSDEGKFRALGDDLARTDIKSPAEGQVVGLAVQTVGAVVQSGQKLMDIVPENELLLIETKVAPNLIDRIRAGLPVDIRFNAFANSPQLVVDGKVVSISGDLLTEQSGGQYSQYYLARIAVTPDGLKRLGKRVMQPGMPVEVILKTGERSLLAYLMHPFTRRLAAAMKEE